MTGGAEIARLASRLRNLIRQADDGRRRDRPLERVTTCAWHRLSFASDGPTDDWPDVQPVPDEDLDGLAVTARFADTRRREYIQDGVTRWYGRAGAYTGGQSPYHMLVRVDGSVDQLVELSDTAIHAGRWNAASVGIAVAGDFRRLPPGLEQWRTCVTLAALLGAWGLEHKGHDDLPGGSADASKRCPGPHFSLPQLRTAAKQHELAVLERADAELLMGEAGIVV